MKALLVTIPALIAVLSLNSCNREKSTAKIVTTPAVSAAQAKPYLLETCLVSGEKLGGMGAPFVIQHEGQEVKFCCKNCLPEFKKDPAKFLAKLK